MTDSNYTSILMLVDRSGSMSLIKEEAEQAINSFIKDQSAVEGKCTIRLVDFSNTYRVVQKSRSAKRFPKYKMEPHGMTALYDAIGDGVKEFGQELEGLTEEERPAKVLVVIITDGHENASKSYNANQIKEMITHQQDAYKWSFVYLGANQDAVFEGGLIGIRPEATLTYEASADGVTRSGLALTRTVNEYRETGTVNFDVDKV